MNQKTFTNLHNIELLSLIIVKYFAYYNSAILRNTLTEFSMFWFFMADFMVDSNFESTFSFHAGEGASSFNRCVLMEGISGVLKRKL